MSGSLLEIQKRIKATKNTRKITKAMQLVAASKMRKFQKKAVSARGYAWELLNVFRSGFDDQSLLSLCEQRNEGKIVFVLYTSDKGLCGALNSRLIKALVQSDLWRNTAVDDRILITIGKKSMDYAKYNKIAVAKSFNGMDESLTTLDALELIDSIVEYWEKHKVQKIVMVAPHYKNSLVFYPIVKTFLPFSLDMISEHLNVEIMQEQEAQAVTDTSEEFEPPMIYESDEDTFKEHLIEQLVISLFIQSFLELKAAEYSSRMIAMQNATEAAGDIIDRLSLQFNKARQAAITQEIAELVSGSMV